MVEIASLLCDYKIISSIICAEEVAPEETVHWCSPECPHSSSPPCLFFALYLVFRPACVQLVCAGIMGTPRLFSVAAMPRMWEWSGVVGTPTFVEWCSSALFKWLILMAC